MHKREDIRYSIIRLLFFAFFMFVITYSIELLFGGAKNVWVVAIAALISLTFFLIIANLYYLRIYKQFNPYILTWSLFGFYILIRIIAKIIISIINDSFTIWGVILPPFGLAEILPPVFIPILIKLIKRK